MAFGAPGGTRGANILFEANTGQAKAGITELGRVYTRTTGAMSTDALRLVAAQDRLNRTIERSGPESAQAARATVAYRKEIDAIAVAANRETVALDRTNRELGQTVRGAIAGSGVFRSFGRSLAFASGGFLGAAGFVHLTRSALDASSALAEQVDAAGRVFKSSAPVVKDFADNALGLARDQALGAATGIGTLLRPLGILPGEAAKTSIQLTKLGIDLASLKDTPVPDALDAIRSGLVGESEPLRRYGILLSEARVQQVALAETGKTSAKELTNREKVQARVAIIMRDSALAQNNYADTVASTANQEREAQKNFRNTAIAIGDVLQPTYRNLLGDVNAYLGDADNQKRIQAEVNTLVQEGGQVAHGLADAFGEISDVLSPLVELLGGTKEAVKLLILAMAVGKVRAFATALGLIGPAAVEAAAVSTAATGIEAAGTASLIATGRVAGLRGALLGLSGLQIAIPITLAITAKAISESDIGKALHLDYSGRDLAHDIGRIIPGGHEITVDEALRMTPAERAQAAQLPEWTGGPAAVRAVERPAVAPTRLSPDTAEVIAAEGASYGTRGGSTAGKPGAVPLTAGQQRSRALSQARLTAGTADDAAAARQQAAYDQRALAFLEQRRRQGKITNKKYLDQYQALADDLASQQSTLASIADAAAAETERHAAEAKASEERAQAAREKAARERQRVYEAALRTQALELKNAITTAGRTSRNVGAVGRHRTSAEDALIAFYKREAHDQRLSGEERARYQQLLLQENDRTKSEVAKFNSDWAKSLDTIRKAAAGLGLSKAEIAEIDAEQIARNNQVQEQILQNRLAAAGLISDPAKQKQVEGRVLRQQIQFWHRLAANETDQLTRLQDRAQEIAARQALKALNAKTATTSGAEIRDSFLGDVQRIVGGYAPNFSLGLPTGGGGKAETHLHNLVHENRQTNAHLRTIVGRGKQPSSGYATEAALAAFG